MNEQGAVEMAERPGIMFYFDLEPALSMLEDEDVGKLFRAAMEYGHYGVVPELDGKVAMAWSFIQTKIDRDGDAYQKTCVQNAYNRYLGECKKHGTTPLSMEAWEVEIYNPKQRVLTTVDDGSIPSPTITGTTTTAITTTGAPAATGATATTGGGEGARGKTGGDANDRRNAALEKLEGYRRGG